MTKQLTLLLLLLLPTPLLAGNDQSPLELAQSALDQWRADRAVSILEQHRDPENVEWLKLKGLALITVGRIDEAMPYLEDAKTRAPEDAEPHWYRLAGLTASLNDSGALGQMRLARQIRRALETVVELDPDNPEYRLGLMQFHMGAPRVVGGRSSVAEEQRQRLAEIDPHWGLLADALFLISEKEQRAGLDGLLQAWDEGRGIEDAAMPAVFNAQALEDWAAARKTLHEYLAMKPGNPSALYQLGRTAALSGEDRPAGKAALEEYLALPFHSPLMPSAAAAWRRLGEIHLAGGDAEQAQQAWHQALKLDPEFEEARLALEALQNGEDEEKRI
ncbi:tetratricopeptide repeat protein [Natronospira bacteriovora]|uniref:Tetratricopeptide repeat protein n=1 Tax=Natronospira bacteriovora TaxID=3069753 RepID=A0ABU0W7Q7_9GAMM|nr:tetratricopeptide repeat protein [Natronospira sp. AB-CW4]MDQ2069977.1 tetratricopeptide repeat protein [Natronospira sp. AB-CW4]